MRWFSAATRILLGLPLVLAAADKENSKPNILFLFTDDQDYELGSLDFLPRTTERILDQGTYSLAHIHVYIRTFRISE